MEDTDPSQNDAKVRAPFERVAHSPGGALAFDLAQLRCE
jgi:hypothetical protein